MTKQLGPYRLEKLLGRGGMGSVYVGVHEETGERAAIKSLSCSLADDENFRSRFLVEVATLKQLRHTNIVRILGEGEQNGQLFYVMELVEGKSLQELLLAGHIFGWREVTHIAIDICAALKHAHDSGVIHRDLKPANLLRTADGVVKLTDFGIAKLFGATHFTAEGSVVGTADFMSPEQSDGRPVTNRTDLYSLGAVMFTLLARRAPFQGGTLAQVVHKLKYEDAPSVRRFTPHVPEALDQIVGELLRKDPQQRVATALVLANRLRAMEHVLTAREGEVLAPDEITRIGPLPGGENAAAPVAPSPKPTTKVSPTVENGGDELLLGGFAWNDATVQSSVPQSQAEKPSQPVPVASPAASTPPPANRFTVIDDDMRRSASVPGALPEDPPEAWRGIGWIVLVLAGIVGACVWGLSPPSANSLYQRIVKISAAEGPADAEKYINQFLDRFPDDPRSQEISDLRMDLQCAWLESRLRVKKRKSDGQDVESYEQTWLEAYRSRLDKPALAREKWESILREYGQQPAPAARLQTILAATRHQLKRQDEQERDP